MTVLLVLAFFVFFITLDYVMTRRRLTARSKGSSRPRRSFMGFVTI